MIVQKESLILYPGEGQAGFLIATQDSKAFDDPGEFRELELVNRIRNRVDDWREKNYPNVTGITRQLLEFWRDKDKRQHPFFFCQMEAVETLIWLTEASDSEQQGIQIPSDGGNFERLCCQNGHWIRKNHCNGNVDCLADS